MFKGRKFITWIDFDVLSVYDILFLIPQAQNVTTG